MFIGSRQAKVLVISDFMRIQENAEQKVLAGERELLLSNAFRNAGVLESEVAYTLIHPVTPRSQNVKNLTEWEIGADIEALKKRVNESEANILVPLGEYALRVITGLESISKWHCSLVLSKAEYGGRKALPLYHPEHVQKVFSDHFYLRLGAVKIKSEMESPETLIPERRFLLSLDLSHKQITEYLQDTVLKASELSVDIETGHGVINTHGFAVSPYEAIAIDMTSSGRSVEEHHELWSLVHKIYDSPMPKIAQNAIYEIQWASRYGMRIRNLAFDTQWAMKFLNPELEKGLDNVGRVYTPFPYWKDDHSDWNNIRNWRQHLEYNCKDTTGQFMGKVNMLEELKVRKLDQLFFNHTMRFLPVVEEMCARGISFDPAKLKKLQEDIGREAGENAEFLKREFTGRLQRDINLASPKQLKQALKDLGYEIPVQKGKESTDKKAIMKLRKKFPKEIIFPLLVKQSKLSKQLSSYVGMQHEKDNKLRYTLDGCATETFRMAGYNDPWGNGFNPQTAPKFIRKVFCAEEGKILVQIDLQQAESRYVAYEAPEPELIRMLECGEDVHRYVAGRIFKKPAELIAKNSPERQLGKKSGHAANYGVGPRTFVESALAELDLVLTEVEAKRIIAGYFSVFPGIRKRQETIKQVVRSKRFIKTPFGHERVFWGRICDDTFREAFAFAPQCTIPTITNCLMLFLYDHFPEVEFLLQVHDSLLLQISREMLQTIINACQDYDAWHPEILLPGGKLTIPVDIEYGTYWGSLEKV